jgi:hypothetical protein
MMRPVDENFTRELGAAPVAREVAEGAEGSLTDKRRGDRPIRVAKDCETSEAHRTRVPSGLRSGSVCSRSGGNAVRSLRLAPAGRGSLPERRSGGRSGTQGAERSAFVCAGQTCLSGAYQGTPTGGDTSQPSGAVAEESSGCGCSVPGRGSASGMALVMLGGARSRLGYGGHHLLADPRRANR